MKSPRKVIASLFVTPISLFLIIGGFSAGFCPVAQAAGSGQRTADHITITADLTRYLRAAAAGERPAQIILNRITQALASIPKNKDGSPIDPAWFAEQLKKALPDLHLRPVERTSGVYEGVPYLELTSIAFDRETGNYIVHIDTDTAMGATFTIHKNTVTSLLDKQGRRRGNGSTLYSGHRLRNWPRGHGGSRGAHSRLATDEPFQTLELRPLLSGAAGLDVFMPDHQTGELVEVGTPAAVPYHISTNTNARIPQDQTAYAVLGDKAYAITDTSITPLDETIDALARDQVARAEGEATVSTVPITGYFTHLTKNGGNLTLSTPTGNAPFTFPINQGRVYQAAQVEGLVLDNTCVTQLPNGSTVISIYTGQTMKGSGQDSNYFYSSFIILLDGSVYSQGNLNLSQAVKAANNPTMENLANRTQLRAPTVTLPDGVTTITKNGVNFTFSSSAPTNGYVLTPRALYGTQRAAYDATVVNDASFSASTVRAASPTVSVLAIHTNYLFQQYYSQHWFALFAIGTDGSVTYLGDASGYITITDALDQGVARVNNPTSADLALRFPMRPADPSSTITIDTHMTATKLLGAEMITISRLAGENFSFSTAPAAADEYYIPGIARASMLTSSSTAKTADGTAIVVLLVYSESMGVHGGIPTLGYEGFAIKNDGTVYSLGLFHNAPFDEAKALTQAVAAWENHTGARTLIRQGDLPTSVTYTVGGSSVALDNTNLTGNIVLTVSNTQTAALLGTHQVAKYPAGVVDISSATDFQTTPDGMHALVAFRDTVAGGTHLLLVNSATGAITALEDPSATAGTRGNLAGRNWLTSTGVAAVALGKSTDAQANARPAILTWDLNGSPLSEVPLAGEVMNATFNATTRIITVYYVSATGLLWGDADRNGVLSARDALLPINLLNGQGSAAVRVPSSTDVAWELVSDDGLIRPSNILHIINSINSRDLTHVTTEEFVLAGNGTVTTTSLPFDAAETQTGIDEIVMPALNRPEGEAASAAGTPVTIVGGNYTIIPNVPLSGGPAGEGESARAEAAIATAQSLLGRAGVNLAAIDGALTELTQAGDRIVLLPAMNPVAILPSDRSPIDPVAAGQV